MKQLIILIFLPFCGLGQMPAENLQEMITVTKEIMLQLFIPIRTNLQMDDPIKIKVDSSLIALNAKFGLEGHKGVMMRSNEYSMRFYKNPLLKLSPLLYSVFSNKKDTSLIVYNKVKSIIIHELTHYLQQTWDENVYSDEWSIQFNIPVEFEAYCVSSYYFLSLHNNELLTEIMALRKPLKKKEELLINAMAKILYPWKIIPFFEN